MKHSLKTKLLGLLVLSVVFVAGCTREAEQTPSTQTPDAPPLDITYCDIAPSDLCLEGFGEEDEDKMLILMKAHDQFFTDIYVHAEQEEEVVLFECLASLIFPENVFCIGDAFSEEKKIKLEIFSKNDDRLVAIGVFNVQYSAISTPDVEFGASPAVPAEPIISTPTPGTTYPNYPNPTPSYPNSTPTP
jgi:hypothetical protein